MKKLTIFKKEDGFKDFVCSYGYNCKQWCLTIRAESFADAKSRLDAIGAWGKVDGILIAEIPAALGPFVKLTVWMRGFFSSFG